ncbi:condensation domain-containing protein [Streptomyces xanthochromogenes]|uniref:condensation domain-containing protein n=1 Tax=Streptomyces xanthochromogenes TaxID=67384 RepID=UPI00342A3CA4
MDATHPADVRHVAFDGASHGANGLTWSQARFRHMMLDRPEGRHVYVPLHLSLPEDLRPGIDDTLRCLRTVLIRHDALRTTYGVNAAGDPVQTVAAAGALPVEIWPVPETGAAGVHRYLYEGMREKLFTLDAFPLRAALFTDGDTVRRVALLFSPITLDDWGLSLVKEELLALLRRGDAPLTPHPWQPAQQYAWEQSPEGRRRSESAMAYWTRQLSLPAPPLFSDHDGAAPSDSHGFHETVFESPAVLRASREVAVRYRTSIYTVLTAAVLAALSARSSTAHHHFGTYVHNRFAPRSRTMVGPLSQSVTVGVEVGGKSFGDVVGATAQALLPAYRNAAYDLGALDALRERLREERGEPAAPRLFLNLTNSKADSTVPASGTGEPMEELVARSHFRRIAEPVAGWTDLYLGIRPYADYTGFFARGDGRAVSRPVVETLLRGIETLLVVEAAGRRLTPADVRAIAGT